MILSAGIPAEIPTYKQVKLMDIELKNCNVSAIARNREPTC